ncbi:TPA: tail fiber assembly protein [Pseudomonas putida]
MIIKLSPVGPYTPLSLYRSGDALTINGVTFDLSRLPDGATLPASAISSTFLLNPIERVDGKLRVTLVLPFAADAPVEARFPEDIVDPADGVVVLPGIEPTPLEVRDIGVIDWTQVITADDKARFAAEQHLIVVQSEIAQRRAAADYAIAPLQDAVDLDEATAAEAALLKDWKRYRIALNRLPEQPGYPTSFDWPVAPA